jgi:hypothetical protein
MGLVTTSTVLINYFKLLFKASKVLIGKENELATIHNMVLLKSQSEKHLYKTNL